MGFFRSAPARAIGPAAILAAVLVARPAIARPTQGQDHQAAVAALGDLRAAIGQIVSADTTDSTDRAVYHRAGQRAINALEGRHGTHYVAAAGSPGDAEGAIGHIDALLDRTETPVWADPLRGAAANMQAAAAYLHDAVHARELMAYRIAASQALAYLEVALGRPSQSGVLGGLEGALANTVLGVPAGARIADACTAPPTAPAYGTHDGRLAWVSIPAKAGAYRLAEPPGGTRVEVKNGMAILYTAAAPTVAKACGGHLAAAPRAAAPKQTARVAPAPAAEPVAGSATALPKLYTAAQAEAGKQVFATHCVVCHGANLQGVSAPAVAGTDFLKTAKQDHWTLWVIRYIVTTQMPKNAAKSLSPTAYADVIGYLLASNCYPAGTKPFPTSDQPSFKTIQLAPLPGHPSGQNGAGVCPVG